MSNFGCFMSILIPTLIFIAIRWITKHETYPQLPARTTLQFDPMSTEPELQAYWDEYYANKHKDDGSYVKYKGTYITAGLAAQFKSMDRDMEEMRRNRDENLRQAAENLEYIRDAMMGDIQRDRDQGYDEAYERWLREG